MAALQNHARAANETAAMAEATDRTPKADTRSRDAVEHIRAVERRAANQAEPKPASNNAVVRIVIETVLIFSVCLLIYFIYRSM